MYILNTCVIFPYFIDLYTQADIYPFPAQIWHCVVYTSLTLYLHFSNIMPHPPYLYQELWSVSTSITQVVGASHNRRSLP